MAALAIAELGITWHGDHGVPGPFSRGRLVPGESETRQITTTGENHGADSNRLLQTQTGKIFGTKETNEDTLADP